MHPAVLSTVLFKPFPLFLGWQIGICRFSVLISQVLNSATLGEKKVIFCGLRHLRKIIPLKSGFFQQLAEPPGLLDGCIVQLLHLCRVVRSDRRHGRVNTSLQRQKDE